MTTEQTPRDLVSEYLAHVDGILTDQFAEGWTLQNLIVRAAVLGVLTRQLRERLERIPEGAPWR